MSIGCVCGISMGSDRYICQFVSDLCRNGYYDIVEHAAVFKLQVKMFCDTLFYIVTGIY
jgi:hypothetical protein